MRALQSSIFGLGLTLVLSGAAFAAQTVTLKPQVTASGAVTLGDLFEGAGRASGVVIAPAISNSGSLVLDAAAVQRAAMNAGLAWTNETGMRRVIVRGGAAATATSASRPAAGAVDVLTYNRSLEAGEIVQAEDLSWTKLAAAPQGAPRDADALIGKAAKRPLRSGSAASSRDVTNPLIIKQGEMIEVAFADSGINLTLQAKAMTNGAVGDTLSLMNMTSKKIIQAVIAAPGKAVVGPQADLIRAQTAASSQFASR